MKTQPVSTRIDRKVIGGAQVERIVLMRSSRTLHRAVRDPVLAFLQVIPQATHVTVMTRNGEGPVAGVAFVYRDHHHRIETSMKESAKIAAVKT